jgi:hypothetical protein
MFAVPKVNKRLTAAGLCFLFKIPLFFNFSVKIFQSTLIFIEIEVSVSDQFFSTCILDLEI